MKDVRATMIAYVRERAPGAPASDENLLNRDLRDLIDSVDMIDFLAFIESTFAIEIVDDEVTPETFATLASAVKFVRSRTAV